jgi:hypothetical protein
VNDALFTPFFPFKAKISTPSRDFYNAAVFGSINTKSKKGLIKKWPEFLFAKAFFHFYHYFLAILRL